MEKKTLTILIIIAVILIFAIVILNPKTEKEIKFKLVDGDTEAPISNQQIFICDDSVELRYIGEYPYSSFCDGEHRKIIKKVSTDSSGVLLLNIQELDVKPPYNIVFDIGNSDDRWGIVKIERSDTITHHYHPLYIRALNQDRFGHVNSNLIYNLDSNEVKEIFTSDGSEKTYTFDVVRLNIFKKE